MRSRSYRIEPPVYALHDAAASDLGRLSPVGRLFRGPKDVLGLCAAVAATSLIIVNALVLQAGPHPAPIFAELTVPAASPETATGAVGARPRPAERRRSGAGLSAATPAAATRLGPGAKPLSATPPAGAVRHDPIAELLEPSNRMIAVQRALTEFGYGQVKPTGTFGPETKTAIERFERERNLPVTGQISERLTRELTAMKGGPL